MRRNACFLGAVALLSLMVVLDVASAQDRYNIIGGGLAATADGKTAIMFWQGMPFPPPKSLIVEGELLNTSPTIKIEAYDKEKRLLIPSKDSAIPQGEPDWSKSQMGKWFTNAANVTWEFTKAGISFEVGGTTYISMKDGAKIVFTNEGVLLDGIKKSPEATMQGTSKKNKPK